MEIVCHYCGVAHASVQSFCNGCGGALPVSDPQSRQEKTPLSWRHMVGAVVGLALVATAVLVIASRLSGPQQVEIVNVAGAQVEPQLAAMVSTGTPSTAAQKKYVINAQFTAAYISIQALRMMLNEYRMMEGDYPADFTAMRIDPAELTDGEYVTGVALQPGGVLVVSLESSVFGNNAVLKLTPTDVMAGTRTRWDCTTSVPDDDRISGPGGIPCPFDPGLT